MSTGVATEDAVARYLAASEANDIGGLLATLAPDAELVSPISGHMVFRGRPDLEILLGAIYGSLRSLRWGPPMGEGDVRFAIAESRVLGVRLDDAMVFELAPDGMIKRIRPHLRPWFALTLLALVLPPKLGAHLGVVVRALRG
ncbi:MAG TPA: nuclear transport factor 2 family protein [Solirubrobacteraceae bacterium]|nr:nuclear transport factor 2 family protein [Solirubrobacteraceae bacterium]